MKTNSAELPTYYDGGRRYLELHAMRAPVGHYRPEIENDSELYDHYVDYALLNFQIQHNVELFTLGRSGRHICIKDTEENRARYQELSDAAVRAARELWRSMRTKGA